MFKGLRLVGVMIVILRCDLNMLLGFAMTAVMMSRCESGCSVGPPVMLLSDGVAEVTQPRMDGCD